MGDGGAQDIAGRSVTLDQPKGRCCHGAAPVFFRCAEFRFDWTDLPPDDAV